MKKVVSLLIGIMMLGLTGCMKSGNNITNFTDISAIVALDLTTFQPALITSMGKVIAPGLPLFTELNEGDAILTDFSIDYDTQPSNDYIQVSGLSWKRIGKTFAHQKSSGEVTTDYDSKIEGFNIFDIIGYDNYTVVFFLELIHTGSTNQAFDYEMIYDTDTGEELPSVYIRAKKNGTGTNSSATFTYLYAFDMTNFIQALRGNEKTAKFDWKYKTGETDGKEDYQGWGKNPYEIIYE